jgi:hypothetical protein
LQRTARYFGVFRGGCGIFESDDHTCSSGQTHGVNIKKNSNALAGPS